MELRNEQANEKIVFMKIDNKLCVEVREDYNFNGYGGSESFMDIDFEEFINNIEKIKSSKGEQLFEEEE